jgi:hypothetical protein
MLLWHPYLAGSLFDEKGEWFFFKASERCFNAKWFQVRRNTGMAFFSGHRAFEMITEIETAMEMENFSLQRMDEEDRWDYIYGRFPDDSLDDLAEVMAYFRPQTDEDSIPNICAVCDEELDGEGNCRNPECGATDDPDYGVIVGARFGVAGKDD